jgi:hypothetical protein
MRIEKALKKFVGMVLIEMHLRHWHQLNKQLAIIKCRHYYQKLNDYGIEQIMLGDQDWWQHEVVFGLTLLEIDFPEEEEDEKATVYMYCRSNFVTCIV